jgi:mRNA interferase MazF
MNRGDVCWYKFKEPDKRRPVLVLTRNSIIRYLNEITIAPITTTIREIPSEVLLTPDDGMHNTCVANCDHIQTVPKDNLGILITHLSTTRMEEVKNAILFALGLDNDYF